MIAFLYTNEATGTTHLMQEFFDMLQARFHAGLAAVGAEVTSKGHELRILKKIRELQRSSESQ